MLRSHMIVSRLVHNVFKHHVQMIFLGCPMRSSDIDMIPARKREIIIIFYRKLHMKLSRNLFFLKTALQCTRIR